MKTLIAISLLVLSLQAQADTAAPEGTSTLELPRVISSRGYRVSLVRDVLTATFNGRTEAHEFNSEDDLNATGITAGYVDLPVAHMGWVADLGYFRMKDKGSFFRAQGNLAYAFTKNTYVKGGLNVMRGETADGHKMNPGLGIQILMGYQISPTIGFDFGYVSMNTKGEIPVSSNNVTRQTDVNATLAGFEFGLTGTF